MKKYILVSLFVLTSVLTQAQRMNPVSWSFQAVKKADKQYDVILTANVEAPWHIYSQFVKKGPIPTTIEFKANPLVQIKGAAKEIGKLEKNFDKNFDAEISYYSNKVQFVQSVTLKVASKTKLSGTIDYTVCNDEKCLPPITIPFEVVLQ
jgi:thiol:disulfide interchange protein DsbD